MSNAGVSNAAVSKVAVSKVAVSKVARDIVFRLVDKGFENASTSKFCNPTYYDS